jgi:hypothetical protein
VRELLPSWWLSTALKIDLNTRMAFWYSVFDATTKPHALALAEPIQEDALRQARHFDRHVPLPAMLRIPGDRSGCVHRQLAARYLEWRAARQEPGRVTSYRLTSRPRASEGYRDEVSNCRPGHARGDSPYFSANAASENLEASSTMRSCGNAPNASRNCGPRCSR